MALIYRDDRPYAYRSVRRGGRVTSEYLGSGDDALRAEKRARDQRENLAYGREADRAEKDAIESAEQPLIDYFDQLEDLARLHLLAIGLHVHKGQWRRRRAERPES